MIMPLDNLENELSEVHKQLRYHGEAMAKPYTGEDQWVYNMEANHTHHRLHARRCQLEVMIYRERESIREQYRKHYETRNKDEN